MEENNFLDKIEERRRKNREKMRMWRMKQKIKNIEGNDSTKSSSTTPGNSKSMDDSTYLDQQRMKNREKARRWREKQKTKQQNESNSIVSNIFDNLETIIKTESMDESENSCLLFENNEFLKNEALDNKSERYKLEDNSVVSDNEANNVLVESKNERKKRLNREKMRLWRQKQKMNIIEQELSIDDSSFCLKSTLDEVRSEEYDPSSNDVPTETESERKKRLNREKVRLWRERQRALKVDKLSDDSSICMENTMQEDNCLNESEIERKKRLNREKVRLWREKQKQKACIKLPKAKTRKEKILDVFATTDEYQIAIRQAFEALPTCENQRHLILKHLYRESCKYQNQ